MWWNQTNHFHSVKLMRSLALETLQHVIDGLTDAPFGCIFTPPLPAAIQHRHMQQDEECIRGYAWKTSRPRPLLCSTFIFICGARLTNMDWIVAMLVMRIWVFEKNCTTTKIMCVCVTERMNLFGTCDHVRQGKRGRKRRGSYHFCPVSCMMMK